MPSVRRLLQKIVPFIGPVQVTVPTLVRSWTGVQLSDTVATSYTFPFGDASFAMASTCAGVNTYEYMKSNGNSRKTKEEKPWFTYLGVQFAFLS